MADPHVITALVKRRAELAGQIEATHEALRKMVLDLENLDATILAAARGQADQSKINAEAQKIVVTALIAMGKNPTAAERILQKLETAQNDDLSAMEKILNDLDGKLV
jgi:hypothetical protein